MVVGLAWAGTLAWSFATDLDLWRFDLQQALDGAGLYLFFMTPLYAAVSAWLAGRAVVDLGVVLPSLPGRSLVWRLSLIRFAVLALVAHGVTVLLYAVTAVVSGAVGGADIVALAVQFLAVAAFCGFGAWVGSYFTGYIAPAVVFLSILAGNTVLVQYGFRRISNVGTGSADFVDLTFRVGYLYPRALMFLAFVIFALPLRALVRRLVVVRFVCVLAVCVLAFNTMSAQGDVLTYTPTTPRCHATPGGERVCVPKSLAGEARRVDEPLDRALALLRDEGVTVVPTRTRIYSRGATSLDPDAVTLTISPAQIRDEDEVRAAIALGLTYAQNCDDPQGRTGPLTTS
ncbi:hypothetical protein GCM10025864_11720 [Luteimicrobium album]|uniref:ABC transporter permease n=1 Tax=Luteimicrobium album TaxID=1054550 RepID=A0ABQ6HY30_9MICO|nr:hypothetical protein GCM10025864_11720 [Luteimicrobium album]